MWLLLFQFIAHPNCQQHLTSIWYGPEMGFLQSLTLWKKVVMWFVCVPLVPIFCLIYIVTPHSKVLAHSLSHILYFLPRCMKCVTALILRFSSNSIALRADYVTVVENRPIMSVKYCLPVPVFHVWPKVTHPVARSPYDS